ncbi:hypothetical protein TeGR_g7809 [Tetraparma gracilis]|uniref:Uncharacterized protein n=1 Tax=Tetraparma gracilis TaxID=2962635 RepID=A0ABQ6NBI3_9STRA|nr:hypothetical protein TeGR_g7809 [Tetraparma gracilis]
MALLGRASLLYRALYQGERLHGSFSSEEGSALVGGATQRNADMNSYLGLESIKSVFAMSSMSKQQRDWRKLDEEGRRMQAGGESGSEQDGRFM